MANHPKIHKSLMAGSVFLAVIVLIMGVGSFLNIRKIRIHADLLVTQNLPQWALANTIYKHTGEIGYFMATYEQNLDPATWERARSASDICMQHIRAAQTLAQTESMDALARRLKRMEDTLLLYQQVMARSRIAGENITENHKTVKRSAHLFIENISAYNQMQQEEMERQISAAFGGESMIRFGLNLASESELKIRHARIQAGSQILAQGNGLYAGLWEAETQRNEARLEALLPDMKSLHDKMATLLGVTRQPQNLRQLRSALTALEANEAAVEHLVRTRQIAENASKAQKAAYQELLSLAADLSTEAHNHAMHGGSATRRIVAHSAKVPLQLGAIGAFVVFFLLFLYGWGVQRRRP
jgi:DNA segregation ATPase FtsK/SpoIIIE-like protein